LLNQFNYIRNNEEKPAGFSKDFIILKASKKRRRRKCEMEVDGNCNAGDHAQNAGVHAGGCPRRGGQQAPAPAGAHYRARRRGYAERSEALEFHALTLEFRTEKHCFLNSQQIFFL
jgi:hypothetical protein